MNTSLKLKVSKRPLKRGVSLASTATCPRTLLMKSILVTRSQRKETPLSPATTTTVLKRNTMISAITTTVETALLGKITTILIINLQTINNLEKNDLPGNSTTLTSHLTEIDKKEEEAEVSIEEVLEEATKATEATDRGPSTTTSTGTAQSTSCITSREAAAVFI